MDSKQAFVSAGQLPWKVIRRQADCVVDGMIVPIHLQFNPTNRCNSNCKWCSCRDEDRSLELDISEIADIVSYFARLGTEAVTITGGGEPTMHPEFETIIKLFEQQSIAMGLVTNGIILSKTAADLAYLDAALTWARISVTDTENEYSYNRIIRTCNKLPNVDIGISFVVGHNVNMSTAIGICNLATAISNITHIRFVQNIFDPNDTQMDAVKRICTPLTDKAIYQYRSDYTSGTENCYISLLKPVLWADGYMYPCCGVQYATDDLHHMPESFRMCRWESFDGAAVFDGSRCKKCYYESYNNCLDALQGEMAHESFV